MSAPHTIPYTHWAYFAELTPAQECARELSSRFDCLTAVDLAASGDDPWLLRAAKHGDHRAGRHAGDAVLFDDLLLTREFRARRESAVLDLCAEVVGCAIAQRLSGRLLLLRHLCPLYDDVRSHLGRGGALLNSADAASLTTSPHIDHKAVRW